MASNQLKCLSLNSALILKASLEDYKDNRPDLLDEAIETIDYLNYQLDNIIEYLYSIEKE